MENRCSVCVILWKSNFCFKMVIYKDGKIPLEKFIEILEEDPVWKESVPKPLKDKIIDEVRHP